MVSAAGRFNYGEVEIQWATDQQAADNKPGGSTGLADVGAAPAWRNLRAPLSALPQDATQVRVVVNDEDLAPQHWIAVTPPRIPRLRTLQDVVGSSEPVLLDWLVGLAFPCQRPFGHQNGVDEVPRWRILPDRFGAEANSPVMDKNGGGPLGVTELLARPSTVPTYLKDDWSRDWGALQQLTPYYPNAGPARTRPGFGDPQRIVEPSAAAAGLIGGLTRRACDRLRQTRDLPAAGVEGGDAGGERKNREHRERPPCG